MTGSMNRQNHFFSKSNPPPLSAAGVLSCLLFVSLVSIICEGPLDAVQEEGTLLDIVFFQIRFELLE